ncbi:MAG: ABC-2 transporter permease [Ruminococcus sp.]|uniref:ABC-2 transporter permease n=1 Tax=Ruminococcus sp. TaxID=41978 RepID=UPI001B0DA677|nr:ABC-2 transporter permease [Ruminococcus sp.]MBO7473434.1 ABC-2 transporter permease [Ruminococcus sp.]
MKGLIYRELYLIRKTIVITLLVYFIFVAMMSLVCISTYAGNLKGVDGVIETFYPQAYFYAACIALVGMGYGHNDIIQKDYQSRWQLFSYTLPVSDRKIIASKFIVRGILLLTGLVLAILAEVIIAAAAKMPVSADHIKNILILGAVMTLCFSEIPLMLRFKNQNKGAVVTLLATSPFMAACFYFAWRFTKFCMSEAERLYGEVNDKTMAKVLTPYFDKAREICFIIAPFFVVGVIALLYVWSLKEYRRRRY